MICFACGHKREEHCHPYHDPKLEWCSECYRFAANKKRNKFYKHPFMGNLEYLEEKANELYSKNINS